MTTNLNEPSGLNEPAAPNLAESRSRRTKWLWCGALTAVLGVATLVTLVAFFVPSVAAAGGCGGG
ncbi:MAG TPA: hypothetical protein VFN61_08220 [Acidimicrobiales bacterium]|nr:hypothetical protein [Acidimicrobiales bacterium]